MSILARLVNRDHGHTKLTALPSRRSSAEGGIEGYRMGYSRSRGGSAGAGVGSACGVKLCAQGFKRRVVFSCAISEESCVDMQEVAIPVSFWLRLCCSLGDVMAGSGVGWQRQGRLDV